MKLSSAAQERTSKHTHGEIAIRYAWQARQRRKEKGVKTDPVRLLTLIRLRELERLFVHRYGRLLPDDDAGLDDLTIAAHHVAHMGGDIIDHIVAWARAWAPWMPPHQADRLANDVAAEPKKWTADKLAWRLRLTMAERTALKITTIGALDMSRAEREVERKRKRAEAERACRARKSTGKQRGRPKKNAWSAGTTLSAGHAFSQHDLAAREPAREPAAATATPQNPKTASAETGLIDSGEDAPASPTITTTRAALSRQSTLPVKPPPEVIDEALTMDRASHEQPRRGPAAAAQIVGPRCQRVQPIARVDSERRLEVLFPTAMDHQLALPPLRDEPLPVLRESRSAPKIAARVRVEPPPEIIEKAVEIDRTHPRGSIYRNEVEKIIKRMWPGFVRDQRATAQRYYGRFDAARDLACWQFAFRHALDREIDARDRFKRRHATWERESKKLRDHAAHPPDLLGTAAGADHRRTGRARSTRA